MNIPLKVRFITSPNWVLCFRHAVKRAQDGKDIEVEVDDFSHQEDMRNLSCQDCVLEEEAS